MILVTMFSNHLSYGKEEKNCCPDITSIEMQASNSQAQLDQIQMESYLANAKVPSLELNVAHKMEPQKSILEQLHAESEELNNQLMFSSAFQVDVQLKTRIIHEQNQAMVKAE